MNQDVCARHVTLEVPIAAPPSDVWGALTEEINDWWLPESRMVATDSVVSLEQGWRQLFSGGLRTHVEGR